jgi:Tol biopolymer transport system component
VSDEGTEGNASSDAPQISYDGRYVVFNAGATNLVSGDTEGQNDVFISDLKSGTIKRVSSTKAGVGGNGYSYDPAISGNGRYVAYASAASNLVGGDTNAKYDILLI